MLNYLVSKTCKSFWHKKKIWYKGIRDVGNLFNGVALNGVALNQSTDEDYYKPIKTNSDFNGNCIEYQTKRR